MIRPAAGCGDYGDDVRERAIKLFHEIVADDLLLLVPGNLSGDEQETPTGLGQNTVLVTSRRAERFRIDKSEAHDLVSGLYDL